MSKMQNDKDNFEDWAEGQLDHTISKEEWLRLLHDKSVFDDVSLHIVRELCHMPNNAGHVGMIAKADGVPVITYNRKIGLETGPKVLKALQMPPVKHRTNSGNAGWSVLMLGKQTKNGFAWKLRPELAAACLDLECQEKIRPLEYGTVVKDETAFLNEYFGTAYKSQRQVYVKVTPECGVHFIKLADFSKGIYSPTAYNGWINVFSSDESVYYQRNDDPKKMEDLGKDSLKLTLLLIYDFEQKTYTFKGVYYSCDIHGRFGYSYYRVSKDFSPDPASIEHYLSTGARIAAGDLGAVVSETDRHSSEEDRDLVESIAAGGISSGGIKISDDPIEKLPCATKAARETAVKDKRISSEAIKDAAYKCEFDPDHETFIRRADGHPYTEPHHLIPLSKHENFKYSLDHPANIVSLCSNCHNRIHYGKDAHEMIKTLYETRKERLQKAGIGIDLDTLLAYYGLQ